MLMSFPQFSQEQPSLVLLRHPQGKVKGQRFHSIANHSYNEKADSCHPGTVQPSPCILGDCFQAPRWIQNPRMLQPLT